jgi:hypothetical protein
MSRQVSNEHKPPKPGNAGGTDSKTNRHRALATKWIRLDPETDRGEYGLTPLLVHRLGHTIENTDVTFAQELVDFLIERALDGHFPSLEEILIRIDGDAKTALRGARSANAAVEMDQDTAKKLLDVYNNAPGGPSGN